MEASRTRPLVLLAEDDPDHALLARVAFRRAGLPEPIVVDNGEAARAYLAGEAEFGDRVRHHRDSFTSGPCPAAR